MTFAFHIDAYPTSPKRDARLRAYERHGALLAMGSKRNSFGTTSID